jgi:hypothetical protein
MDFYTNLFAGTLAFLIITLVVVGYYMSLAKKKQTYPPSIADCPDYYALDPTDSSYCIIGSNIYASSTAGDGINCSKEDFNKTKYTVEGTDFNSGLCAKKLWANKCKVSWDGISNNDLLCYT